MDCFHMGEPLLRKVSVYVFLKKTYVWGNLEI